MSQSTKRVLIPNHWIFEPKVQTLSELKIRRKNSVTGQTKEINSKSSHFLNDLQEDKQYYRKQLGLSITPQDFPKKTVEFKYNNSPVHSTYTELANQRNVFRPKEVEKRLNELEDNSEKVHLEKFHLPKLSALDRLKAKTDNEQFSSLTPDRKAKGKFYFNENEYKITPKPTEVKYEDYSNKFIYAKSKPVFRSKINFLDIFEDGSKNRRRNRDDFEYRQFKNSSMSISKRLRIGHKKFTSKFLTSGFIKKVTCK